MDRASGVFQTVLSPGRNALSLLSFPDVEHPRQSDQPPPFLHKRITGVIQRSNLSGTIDALREELSDLYNPCRLHEVQSCCLTRVQHWKARGIGQEHEYLVFDLTRGYKGLHRHPSGHHTTPLRHRPSHRKSRIEYRVFRPPPRPQRLLIAGLG